MSLLNNWLELRSDAFKICTHTRRHLPFRTDTIGPWLDNLVCLCLFPEILLLTALYDCRVSWHGSPPSRTPRSSTSSNPTTSPLHPHTSSPTAPGSTSPPPHPTKTQPSTSTLKHRVSRSCSPLCLLLWRRAMCMERRGCW